MRRLGRSVVLALGLALTSGLGLAGTTAPAQADPTDGLIIIPGSGDDLTAIRLRTAAGCPAEASAYYARMKGAGFPPEGLVITANSAAGMSHSSGFDVYLALIMRDFANDNHTTLGGRYDITVFCVHRLTLQNYREFTGSLEFTSPTHYEALGTAKPTGSPPPPLDLNGEGLGVDLYGTSPPAGPPSLASPPSGSAETLPAPAPTAQPPSGVNPQPPLMADRQVDFQRREPAEQRWTWLALGAVATLIPLAVIAGNRLRKRRAR